MIEPTRPLVAALDEIAGRYNATAGQVALNWVINAHGDTIVAIPGASKVEHVTEGAGAMRFRISAAEIDRLSELSSHLR